MTKLDTSEHWEEEVIRVGDETCGPESQTICTEQMSLEQNGGRWGLIGTLRFQS